MRKIRLATPEDLPRIQAIYGEARRSMKRNGNPDQWGDHYPPEALLVRNIRDGLLHVCTEGDAILAVFYFRIGEDPTYARIFEGRWLNDSPYAVIHHIAVATQGKGIAGFCFDYALSQCPDLRIDTHRDNLPMQRALEKRGFRYCGIVYLPNGEERIAYQKCLTGDRDTL